MRQAHFDDAGLHTVVARASTEFKADLMPGAVVAVRNGFERVGTKSVAYVQEIRDVETGRVHSTPSIVEVFFDLATRTAAEIPVSIRQVIEPWVEAG